jgi:hypothetical protein
MTNVREVGEGLVSFLSGAFVLREPLEDLDDGI